MDEELLVDIHILLVDDDATSLAVVSAMLKVCKYQVVTFKNPIEALDTLRARKGFFDLVVTDLHMPQMNGLQLQKKVRQEFKLPVIMMSADEKPSVILKSLEEGVAFYMVKPITLDDVKQVWQYAIKSKKLITPNQTTTIIRRELSIEKPSFKDHSSSLTPCSKEEIKSKPTNSKNKKGKENRVSKKSNATRKEKVIWTNSLHNRFLQAIREVGLDNAVPKKILELMNLPGLTRENVASHLQKYRIFLKRVAEKGASSMKMYSDYTLLRSNFASSHFQHPPFYKSKFQSQYPNFPLTYQCPPILGPNNLSHTLNPNLGSSLAHLGNHKYSSLLTPNKPNFPFNELVSSSARDDQHFVSTGNENPRCSSKGEADRMSCSGQNFEVSNHVQDPHDHLNNNGGLSLDGNFELGTNYQVLEMIYKTNVEENGSAVLVSSEEDQVNVNSWKSADDNNIGFGEIGEHQNYFDVLSEIFMGQNHNNQPSLRKEEMGDMDLSDIWNGIEMDEAKQDLQPSSLSAQAWDDDILETFFGDGSS